MIDKMKMEKWNDGHLCVHDKWTEMHKFVQIARLTIRLLATKMTSLVERLSPIYSESQKI